MGVAIGDGDPELAIFVDTGGQNGGLERDELILGHLDDAWVALALNPDGHPEELVGHAAGCVELDAEHDRRGRCADVAQTTEGVFAGLAAGE